MAMAQPLPDALVELWQADADGVYVRPEDPMNVLAPPGFCGFGRLPTGADGACVFETIRPGAVPRRAGPHSRPRTSTCACSPVGCFDRSTRGSISRATPAARVGRRAGVRARGTAPDAAGADRDCAGEWIFDIRLQGDGETVFFDL